MSTLTTANSCTSQPSKERGVLPNETRKKDAVKIPYVISHLFPTLVAAVVINSFSVTKSSAFEPYQCSSFDVIKTVKRRRFVNISRKIYYGFLCCCHLFLLPCEPQYFRLVADYKTKDRGSVPGRGRHFFLSLMLCPDRSFDSPNVSPNAYKTKHCLPSNAQILPIRLDKAVHN